MEIGSAFRSSGHALKAPAIQLASETCKLASLEVLGKHFVRKGLFLGNDKAIAVREPSDNIDVLFIGKNV